MTIPIHEVQISSREVHAVAAGRVVEAMTDKHMVVLLVADEYYDQTPGRNGAELIPVNKFMIQELLDGGRTGWSPHRSPYVFGIAVQD